MHEITKDPQKAAMIEGLDQIDIKLPTIAFEKSIKVTSDQASFWDLFNYIQRCETVQYPNEERCHIIDDTGYSLKILGANKPFNRVHICVPNPTSEGSIMTICQFEFDLKDQTVMMYSVDGNKIDFENSFPIPIDASLIEEEFPINYGDQIKELLLWMFDSSQE